MITFRLYLIEQRLYVLAASQEKPGQIEQSVLSFFDSFRLLN
ncbi:hypothetical protein [Gloeothece citriformis]|nr:hypothetical protein [Gloeothece citriformis]